MARCLIFVLLSTLFIIGRSRSSPTSDISDSSSSELLGMTAAKTVQPDATGKMSDVAPKSSDVNGGKKETKSDSSSMDEKSSVKPADREASRTHFNELGLLEAIKSKLPSLLPVQSFGYQHYGQRPAPVISSSPVHSVQPISFPQTLASHVQQPFLTAGHVSAPAAGHFAPKPYAVSQQVFHKPVITELQEVVRKPVFAELQEVIHKPLLTEVQQVVKQPLFVQHIVQRPSFHSLHQEVVERPIQLQTQQYHLVAKPLSQIVQLPPQHLVQQPIVQQSIGQPVISGHVVSSPVAGQLSGGLSSYGFLGQGPLGFPWGITKPSSGLSAASFSDLVGPSLSSVSSPVISSLASPVISAVPSPTISSLSPSLIPSVSSSPLISSVSSSPVISSVSSSPLISSVSSSPVISSVSSPVVSEFAYPSYGGHSGELQFLTPSTCRSDSCAARAVDSSEIPINFGGTEFADGMQNGILYNGAAMPQTNFLQTNENLVTPYYAQPQQMYLQQILPTPGSDNGDNNNAADTSMNTKSPVGNAKSASWDSDDKISADSKFMVLADVSDSNSYSPKQYAALSLGQFFRMANDQMKESNKAMESENDRVQNMLQKLRSNPKAIEEIGKIIDGVVN